jgi:CRISPR-associated endonuclease Cas2
MVFIEMSYLVCYDLDKPGQDYTDVINALEKLRARRIQYSVWLLYAPTLTTVQVRDHLAQFIDGNDRLLVVGLQNIAAWKNLMIPGQTVQQFLAA